MHWHLHLLVAWVGLHPAVPVEQPAQCGQSQVVGVGVWGGRPLDNQPPRSLSAHRADTHFAAVVFSAAVSSRRTPPRPPPPPPRRPPPPPPSSWASQCSQVRSPSVSCRSSPAVPSSATIWSVPAHNGPKQSTGNRMRRDSTHRHLDLVGLQLHSGLRSSTAERPSPPGPTPAGPTSTSGSRASACVCTVPTLSKNAGVCTVPTLFKNAGVCTVPTLSE